MDKLKWDLTSKFDKGQKKLKVTLELIIDGILQNCLDDVLLINFTMGLSCAGFIITEQRCNMVVLNIQQTCFKQATCMFKCTVHFKTVTCTINACNMHVSCI